MKEMDIPDSLATRVIKDINQILANRWADEICREDFRHGHAGFYQKYIGHDPLEDNDIIRLMEDPNLLILYHTREMQLDHPQFKNGSILSTQSGDLKVVQKDSRKKTNCADIGMRSPFDIYFEKNDVGKYQLQDGTQIRIYALF